MPSEDTKRTEVSRGMVLRAKAIAENDGMEEAIRCGAIPGCFDTTLSEALVLGLIRQKVSRFITVLGHGSTEIGEVLRIYESSGVVRTVNVRSEIEAAHAAMALRWITGEKAAVVTSIGPGALQALAASLAAASDGVGVWFLFGDETTEDEGPNMQQIPGMNQNGFLKMCSDMGQAYCLHTPKSLPTALRRGLNAVDNPHRGQPFYLLLPMNTQPSVLCDFNTRELPVGTPPRRGAESNGELYKEAVSVIGKAKRVVVKIGGGARNAGREIVAFLDAADAVAVSSPVASGVVPFNHPRNMTVGGSKGSLCGNYAMEHADALVVIGSRFVCQSDCSRTGYPAVGHVVCLNTDPDAVMHYADTVPLVGDCGQTLRRLIRELRSRRDRAVPRRSTWLTECRGRRKLWDTFRRKRYEASTLHDPTWGQQVLTQPAAIKCAVDWAKSKFDVIKLFDAGDVQANGFQVVEDDRVGKTFTETGASYMGWAVSALLATAISSRRFYGLAFSGDGSFMMNPQILIDGVQHGARGCILLFDNRRMGAISGLQEAQYGNAHATWDSVPVDYVALGNAVAGVRTFHAGYDYGSLRSALNKAYSVTGLSLVVVPVYYGPDELGGMGAFGRWNVGNWSEDTQKLRHSIGL